VELDYELQFNRPVLSLITVPSFTCLERVTSL